MALTYILGQPTRIEQLARVNDECQPWRTYCIHDDIVFMMNGLYVHTFLAHL